MSQAEALASHWVLLFFLGLLNKYMLVRSLDYPSIGLSTLQQDSIHRSWSEWTSWSVCSRTCGGGIKMRTRVCNISRTYIDSTANTCIGKNVEYELCSVHNCSPFDKEFLDYQCSLKNGQSVGGKKIEEWVSYRHDKNPCELQCWSKDRTIVHSFGKAIDGTKCATSNPQQSAVCINGRCTPVDCAGQIGEDNRLDLCGVCRGNNSTCIHFQDIFWKRPRVKVSSNGSKDHHYDYEKIVIIPAGTTEVVVKESSENNFLALMDHKGHYQLNGNWRIQSPGRFQIHGSVFNYTRTWDGAESLSTSGPTRFDLVVYVLGSGEIPTVRYEYWISTNNPFKPTRTFQTLNQVKHANEHEIESKHSQPENNHIHDASAFTKKPSIPRAKYQGYKSYYHRNEILKSVPSWSIKRHPQKNNNRLTQNEPPKIHGTNYVTEDTRYVPFDNRQVPSSPEILNRVGSRNQLRKNSYYRQVPLSPEILNQDGVNNQLDKSNYEINLRTDSPLNGHKIRANLPNNTDAHNTSSFQKSVLLYHNRQRYHSDHKPANSKTRIGINSTTNDRHVNGIKVSSSNRKNYYSNQQSYTSVEPARRRFLENIEQNLDENGRPTTTLAQTRNINFHPRSYVTLQPIHQEKSKDLSSKNGKQNDKHKSNGSCQPCQKPKHPRRSFCRSDFVLRATVLSSEKQDDSIRYELDISQSFKNKVPISPREYIWTTDSCRCPKLRRGTEYIVMGNSGTSGNKRESRLLVTRTSFVRKYSHKRARNMLRLVRDQKNMCKNFE